VDSSASTLELRPPENIVPRLLVGLGNPGKPYEDTRHNIGFMVMDVLASRFGIGFQTDKRSRSLVAKFASGWLVKPQTFMNCSGPAVATLIRYFKVAPAETLVVCDDVDLQLGRLRLRPAGSAAGHNGLKSLIESLGTSAFPRLKVGIGGATGRPPGARLSDHVLGRFSTEEKAEVESAVERSAEALITCLNAGLGAAMNLFNRKDKA